MIITIYNKKCIMKLSEYLDKKRIEGKGRKGRGLLEITVQKDEILQAIETGHSIIAIWEALFEQGKVTVQYSSFSKIVKEMRNKFHASHAPTPQEDTSKNKTNETVNRIIPGFVSPLKNKPLHDPNSSRIDHLMVTTKPTNPQE